MFDSLKKEVKTRIEENKELKESVQHEKERLAAKREEAKNGFLRKRIKPIGKLSGAYSERRDEKRLAKFEESEKQKVAEERQSRRNGFIKAHKGKIALAAIIVVAALYGGPTYILDKSELKEESQYDIVVKDIVNEKYEKASKELEELDVDDSKELATYVDVQLSLGSYNGKPESFLAELKSVEGITNKEVEEQQADAIEQTQKAVTAQNDINEIDAATINIDKNDYVTDLSKEVDSIDERYQGLLNTDKLDVAKEIIENIEAETPIGKTVTAIFDIGEVTLESNSKIETARELFDSLSESEKEKVANYEFLTSAESNYLALKQAHDIEVAEKERELAEQKKQQEEIARQAKEEKGAKQKKSLTVYVTKTGKKYHAKGCRYLKSIAESMSESEAKARGYEPCSNCIP